MATARWDRRSRPARKPELSLAAPVHADRCPQSADSVKQSRRDLLASGAPQILRCSPAFPARGDDEAARIAHRISATDESTTTASADARRENHARPKSPDAARSHPRGSIQVVE